MATYEEFRAALISRSLAEVGTGVSEQEIDEAVVEIGPIPDDYRRFLHDFGWLRFGEFDFWGLGEDLPRPEMDFARETMNYVQETKRWRMDAALPSSMVGFYHDGGGNIEGFLIEDGEVAPGVFCFFHEDRQLHRDANSFTDYVMHLLALPPFFADDDRALR